MMSDYLPARMLNEFTYCPRLFYYEHVEGVFADNLETVEGSQRHTRVDKKADEFPPPHELAEGTRPVRSRSVTLSSDTHGVIAKMDLIEAEGNVVTPVDYKRGRPCEAPDGSLHAWDTDRIQLAVQALILRDNGYRCDEAIVYYASTKQRVRVAIDELLVASTLETIVRARETSAGPIPPPRDPVNALLSLAYSMLSKDLTIIAQAVGFDPYLGFFHQPRFGRASLALDLMEPFRPLISDSAVLSAINTRMVTLNDFVRAGDSVALTADGRKKFYRAYEQRMDTLVTHPLFGYRVNYRRLLEIQTRLLARVLTGEMATYPVFTTR